MRPGRRDTAVLGSQGLQGGAIAGHQRLADGHCRLGKLGRCNGGENALGAQAEFRRRRPGASGIFQPVVGSNQSGIVTPQRGQQIRLRQVGAAGAAYQVRDQFHRVALQQRAQRLGGEVAVGIVHLVKVLQAVWQLAGHPLAFRLVLGPLQATGFHQRGEQARGEPAAQTAGVHGGRAALFRELFRHGAVISTGSVGRGSAEPSPAIPQLWYWQAWC